MQSKPLSQSRIERNGVKSGTVAPGFSLPDIQGRLVSLDQYRGERVLLVFSDPHCGPCNDLAPYLVRSYRRRRTNGTHIIVVSRGEFEENRQKAAAHGFEFPVIIQDRWTLSRKYGIFATPAAFLVGEDGRTVRDVAVGFDQIRTLLRREFARGCIEGMVETIDEISRAWYSPIRRRHAFRVAGYLAAGAFLSAIGMEKTALAACAADATACGGACCNNSSSRCCNPATSLCCSTLLVCCNGKCCAPTEVCLYGQCHQQTQP